MSVFNSNQRTSEHNQGEKFSEGVIMEYKIAAGFMSRIG